MNRLWSHMGKWILVVLPVLLAAVPAVAQFTVAQGQAVDLKVNPEPGVTYTWELYANANVDFATTAGDVDAATAEFVNGINRGPSVQVIWHKPGTYFYKVTAVDAFACTNNIKIGRIEIQKTDAQQNPPVAIDDAYTVDCSTQSFDVVANDQYDQNFNIIVSILDWPKQGILHEVDNQGNVTYTVDFFAHGTDSFTYRLCLDIAQTLCDTATVRIRIPDGLNCDPAGPSPEPDTTCHFFIPEGFSPNGDGVHDYFVVDCIERFPDAKMMIFDRQGYLLYEKKNYGNTNVWGTAEADLWWGGQTMKYHQNKDKMVVPGIYLYILDLGNGDFKRGFVMVAYGKGH